VAHLTVSMAPNFTTFTCGPSEIRHGRLGAIWPPLRTTGLDRYTTFWRITNYWDWRVASSIHIHTRNCTTSVNFILNIGASCNLFQFLPNPSPHYKTNYVTPDPTYWQHRSATRIPTRSSLGPSTPWDMGCNIKIGSNIKIDFRCGIVVDDQQLEVSHYRKRRIAWLAPE
jgi:hypothetical protein